MAGTSKVLMIVSIIITLVNYIFLTEEKSSKSFQNVSQTNRTLQKALIILDDWNMIETHSMFWDQMRNASFELEFKMVDEQDIKLDYYGEKIYDSIVLCIPSFSEDSSKNSELSIRKILKHYDEGLNIMIIGDKQVSSYLRALVTEFGVDFDDYESQVKDSLYMHSLKSSLNPEFVNMRNNEIVVSKNIIPIKNVFHQTSGYVLYEGIGMDTDPHNQYLFSILKADENTYSINQNTGLYYNFGEKIKLVTAYQAKNNRRVTITGSSSLCSNKFYFLSSAKGNSPLTSPNAIFCNDLILWNFEKVGVLKYENVKHRRKTDEVSLETYRIKDEIEYMVDIFEYDFKTDSWKPYLTDDLQIEFTMMEPFYRLQLKMLSSNKPTYFTSFKAPDKWGVFKFIIDYKRIGYSYLDVSTKTPLRPYKHNEYDRFLSIAYPYYTSVFCVLIGFVIFSLVFFFSSNK